MPERVYATRCHHVTSALQAKPYLVWSYSILESLEKMEALIAENLTLWAIQGPIDTTDRGRA
jgi:hypothetical protein